jgi:hypothetical protein
MEEENTTTAIATSAATCTARDLHLEFGRDLELVLDLNNVSKLPFLLFSSSFCDNTPCFTICYDMQIRSASVSIRIEF